MIIRIVKMTFLPEQVDNFLELFHSSKQLIRNFPGCTHLELLKQSGHENVFFTYSYWDSETDLDNYRNSELFQSVWAQTKPKFSHKAEAWTLNREVSL